MGIEKIRLFARSFVYWINIDAYIEITINNCSTCLEFQKAQKLKDKMIPHKLPGKPLEVIRADLFNINYRNFLSIVDYFRKFQTIK